MLTVLVVAVVAACTSARAEQHADKIGAAHAAGAQSSAHSSRASTAGPSASAPVSATPTSGAPGAATNSAATKSAATKSAATKSAATGTAPPATAPKTSPPARVTTHPSPTEPTSSAKPTTSPAPSSAPAPSGAAADYTLTRNQDGSVVRWNPCVSIHYTVNAARAADPAGALADVQAAIAKVAASSGLTFVYDGPTTLVPSHAWLDDGGAASSGLVIAWAPRGTAAGQSDLFGGDADGEGGWWESGVSADNQHWTWQIKRGFVVIDPAGARGYTPGFGAGQSRGVLLMHELGHAVGLGHAHDERDVMFPVITSASRAQWGPGDLAGLALVGKAAGCVS